MSIAELAVYTGAALGLGAILLSLLRGTVSKAVYWLWNSFWERFTLSVTFNRTDPGFDMIRDWLAAHPYANRAHRVKLVWDPETTRFTYAPGPGVHYLWKRSSVPTSRLPRGIRYSLDMSCPVYKEPCHEHGFQHGAEAEELRAGIEEVVKYMGRDDIDTDDLLGVKGRLQRLLDRVDARDSLAYLEAKDQEEEE